VDIYFSVFLERSFLPLFILREMNRDLSLIVNTAVSLGMAGNLLRVKESLESEMKRGQLRTVPLNVAVGTFASLLIMPFAGRPLVERCLLGESASFQNFLVGWKRNIVETMCRLLENENVGEKSI